ncbi:MAG: FAD-dependent oxidoreductase [Jannaschia sp.]
MNAPLRDRYDLAFRLYPYGRSADQDAGVPVRHPIVVVGGGPVGLATALDLGLRGVPVVLLDDHEGVGAGSRAICFAKRTLEIAHRLGVGARMLEKGIVWQRGRVFHDRDEIYAFDLAPEDGHRHPAFINLPQPWFEKYLAEGIDAAIAGGAPIQMRGRNRVDRIVPGPDGSRLSISTPDGPYEIEADWVVACDGAKSPIRGMMDLSFEGRVFEDSFLIADVRMHADFPTERWFWFEPWFRSGASALLHKQPDDIWRIDFQLGWDIDRERELQPDKVRARVDAMLGPDVDYDLEWTSIYTFQCRRMERFRHGRVLFAGDAAHQVSPFGARGANSGIQDAENLAWRLATVVNGAAPETLIDGYDTERVAAADENILNSTRATDFLTPKTDMSRLFRDAVLNLARDHAFARPLVNSGRLSVPAIYGLAGPDALPGGPARSRPGAPCPDAALGDGYLLDRLNGTFALLCIGTEGGGPETLHGLPVRQVVLPATGDVADRYLGGAATAIYLIRPDQHVVARWASMDMDAVTSAMAGALRLSE